MAWPRSLMSSPTPRAVLQPASKEPVSTTISIILSVRFIIHDPNAYREGAANGCAFPPVVNYFTRETYSPERVSTLITSPV